MLCNQQVEENRGRVALERGPIVYCLEAVDHGGQVSDILLSDEAQLNSEWRPDLLNGVTVLTGSAQDSSQVEKWLTAIPYYAWAHRGAGEMAVWLPRQPA